MPLILTVGAHVYPKYEEGYIRSIYHSSGYICPFFILIFLSQIINSNALPDSRVIDLLGWVVSLG